MKSTFRKIAIIYCMSILACACIKEVTCIPEKTDNVLIINAQLDASEKHHKVWIGLSSTSSVLIMDNAHVVCSINGEEASVGVYDEKASKVQGCYLIDAELKSGDIVRISAECGKYSAYAEVVVPDITGTLLQVDTLSTDKGMRFTAKIKDESPQQNYYRLRLKNRLFQTYFYDNDWSRWYEHATENKLHHKDDPILDSRIGGSTGDDFFGVGSSTNHYCIFTDRFFNQTSTEIKVSVSNSELYKIYADQYFDKLIALPFVELSLQSISQEEYDYLSVLNVLYDCNYDVENMLEIVSPPSNVIGGMGFVGILSSSTIPIELPRRTFDYTTSKEQEDY